MMIPSVVKRMVAFLTWQKLRTLMFSLASLILTYFLCTQTGRTADSSFTSGRTLSPRDQAGNATLGFQRILALSPGQSWRTRGLAAAAAIAQLEVIVPAQPYIADELVAALQTIGADGTGVQRPNRGSAKAWLAHLDLVKFVIASGLETALIIEDDTDWDRNIRSQMMLVSDGVRTFTAVEEVDSSPYGLGWDILWIGHCGEVTSANEAWFEYLDFSVMSPDQYVGWAKQYLPNIKSGHRAVQQTHSALCTFGYGISRIGAQNVLRVLGHGPGEAFDVALMLACRGKHLRCITINPELMHHYSPNDVAGRTGLIEEANGNATSMAEESFEHLRGSTRNVRDSARCAALYGDVCLPSSR